MGWEFIRGRALIRENTLHVFSRSQTEIVTMKTKKKVCVKRLLQDSILFQSFVEYLSSSCKNTGVKGTMCPYAVFSHKKGSFRQIAPYRSKNYPYFLGQPLINTCYSLPVLITEALIHDLSLFLALSRHPVVGESPVACISLVGPAHNASATIMLKSLGILLHFWGVFLHTRAQLLPSPHKQRWTRVSRIFSEFQLSRGWEEGELQEHFEIKRKHCFMRQTRNYRKLLNTALLSQGLLCRIEGISC